MPQRDSSITLRLPRCLVCLLLLMGICATATGCATGKSNDGSLVVGIKAAQMPETASEFAHAAANFLPPPWNWVATGAATLLFGGASATVINQRRAKQREDAAYDEGQARAYASQMRRHD